MNTKPQNAWNARELERLKVLKESRCTDHQCAIKLGRTYGSVRYAVRKFGFQLPKKQSEFQKGFKHCLRLLKMQMERNATIEQAYNKISNIQRV